MTDTDSSHDPCLEPVCTSCGVPFTKHLGIIGTCAELQRLKIENKWLKGLNDMLMKVKSPADQQGF